MFPNLKNIFLGLFLFTITLGAFSFITSDISVSAQLVPGGDVICGGEGCPIVGDADIDASQENLVAILINAARFLTFVGVGLAVLFMVWGGIRYITAGSSDGAENAKKILINATIGLVVSIVAFTVVTILAGFLSGNVAGNLIP
jgi:hypothetical protein